MTCKGCTTYSGTTNAQRQPTSPFAQITERYQSQSDINVLNVPSAIKGVDVADYPMNPQHANYALFKQTQGIGHTHVYPQAAGTPSERSDSDIWRHLDTWVWGKTGEKSAIKPQIEKHMTESGDRFNSLQDQINTAKAERDSMQSKIDSHSHGGRENGCEWWDIGCHTAGGFQSIGLLAVLGVVGYVLYKKAT